eukprot:CAMPEP_0174870056 /NCGR_PEP_ID=MMETSP1114-20130205/68995_1 /TAXON_ID=312471 /ORGANISM="Neobodo designis, Strain CCAP 1951/1" /LENGTH=106 /DNA_ID=CAMNT_0016105319 /DNA_START=46 /DNA_END=362 /DNA_ORIENTATION=+
MADVDIDQLFVQRSVDEVAAVSRATQRDVAATQLELRTLIGQQYRELLECTDLVVGMDDVCGEIHAKWKALSSELHVPRPTRSKAPAAADAVTTVEDLRFCAFSSV